MKKLLLLLLLSSSVCLAQETKKEIDVRQVVVGALTKHLDKELLGNTPKNSAYLFSVTLSFDLLGNIDTVYFPKVINRNVEEVMKLNDELVRKIKGFDLSFKKYASKIVLIPILYKRMSDTGLDYSYGFLNAFENLLPKISGNISEKSWVVLDPLHVPFSLNVN